jgi:hypothetical protein
MDVFILIDNLNADCHNRGYFDFWRWSAGRCDFKDPTLKWAYCLDERDNKQLCKSCRKHVNRFFTHKQQEVADEIHLYIN